MQGYQSSDNSPCYGLGDELGRITTSIGGTGGPTARKRIADDRAAPTTTRWRRKTPKTSNPDAQQQQRQHQQRMEKRDSITSTGSSSLNSFTIDELVGNLEGLEFELDVDTYSYNNNSGANNNNSSSGGVYYGGYDSLNESMTSRLSAGNWSLRDMEKWSCSMCTYENEPLFCACEMCGQARTTTRAPVSSSLVEDTALPSTRTILENSRCNRDADTIRVQQEQRLNELLMFRVPAAPATTEDASASAAPETPAAASKSNTVPDIAVMLAKTSLLQPLPAGSSSTAARRSISPKPPRSPRPLMKAGIVTTRAATNTSPRPSHSTVPPRHSSIIPGKELLTGDVFDVQKPRRSFNPEDSGATATTFDMSASANTFDMSASWFPEQLVYPGIEEEEAGCAEAALQQHQRRR